MELLDYTKKLMSFSKFGYDYFNIDAVFSDESEMYRVPLEPTSDDDVMVKIRVGKDNAEYVGIVANNSEFEMEKNSSDDVFDYYTYIIKASQNKTFYHFVLKTKMGIYYYSKQGVTRHFDEVYSFKIIPNFKTPDWAKGAVMYQIYVDRFYNGDESNDVVNNEYAYLGKAAKKIDNWNQPVANEDICNFYGGDLQGVIDKMDYLKELGVEVIYFNPIFVSPSNHKYDIQDYDYVDPHYGVIVKDGGEALYFEKFHNRFATMYMQRTTAKENLEASNQLMINLIEIAHKKGIRVILDGVFNHCGAFNKWLDREGFYSGKGYPDGAYKSKESKYNSYFKWYDDNWPNNDCYDGWWGHENHPKLNFEGSKELYDYILGVGKKWVSPPFNADGWRLDVAADLGCSEEFNHKFWSDFRKAVKDANPNAIILAEHYGDASAWLQGDQWDTIMNYDAFMEPVTWFLTGMEKHSEAANESLYCDAMSFESAMRYHNARLSSQSVMTAMNELSNHDHSRFLTRTNRKKGRLHTHGKEAADIGVNKGIMREAVAIQMTWQGSPTIYYGDEAGLTGWTDPDNRRTYPWGNEDMELIEFHKEMIKIHKKYDAIKTGAFEYLYSEYGIISYGRWNENEIVIVVINNNTVEKKIDVPVWRAEAKEDYIFKTIITSDMNGHSTERKMYKITGGNINIKLNPFSAAVYVWEK